MQTFDYWAAICTLAWYPANNRGGLELQPHSIGNCIPPCPSQDPIALKAFSDAEREGSGVGCGEKMTGDLNPVLAFPILTQDLSESICSRPVGMTSFWKAPSIIKYLQKGKLRFMERKDLGQPRNNRQPGPTHAPLPPGYYSLE